MNINFENVFGGSSNLDIIFPDECPLCSHKISPVYKYGLNNPVELQCIFMCTNNKCRKVFISYYKQTPKGHELFDTKPKEIKKIEYSESINKMSPNFIKIYNEAYSAEQNKLAVICGGGYRKALEFLIKDYLIKKTSDEVSKNEIEKEMLGICIDKRISDLNIKNVAKRATWLGNDEVHYLRKWENKDLEDLKKLIKLTVHWIEAETLTADLLIDMPE